MDQKSNSIKDWLLDDRPREKLLLKGRHSLSDAELIAILIGSGTKDMSAVALAQQILQSVNGNWNELAQLGIQDLMKFKGIGLAKAISITTAIEIGRRRTAQAVEEKPIINSSQLAYQYIQVNLMDLSTEEFWVIYLNQAKRVLAKEQISKGGINQTTVDPRIIYRKALELGALNIILAHNHPSGNIEASKSDIILTEKIKQGANLLDICLLDHIIIGHNNYFSFADERLI